MRKYRQTKNYFQKIIASYLFNDRIYDKLRIFKTILSKKFHKLTKNIIMSRMDKYEDKESAKDFEFVVFTDENGNDTTVVYDQWFIQAAVVTQSGSDIILTFYSMLNLNLIIIIYMVKRLR